MKQQKFTVETVNNVWFLFFIFPMFEVNRQRNQWWTMHATAWMSLTSLNSVNLSIINHSILYPRLKKSRCFFCQTEEIFGFLRDFSISVLPYSSTAPTPVAIVNNQFLELPYTSQCHFAQLILIFPLNQTVIINH